MDFRPDLGKRYKKVLICGGRDYDDRAKLSIAMGELDAERGPFVCVISGGARGADAMGEAWARANGRECQVYPADWERHGRAAGSLRNARMLEEGEPDLVIAFPGGRGTGDMMRRARAAGVEVVEAR